MSQTGSKQWNQLSQAELDFIEQAIANDERGFLSFWTGGARSCRLKLTPANKTVGLSDGIKKVKLGVGGHPELDEDEQ